jgi:vacuolar-type H+-ATPase subunit E/Vma4
MTDLLEELDPAVEALLRMAAEEEARIADEVRAKVAAIREQGRVEASAVLRTAREQGGRTAREISSAAEADTRRKAQGILMAARRRVFDEFRAAAIEQVTALLASPEGQPVRASMAERLERTVAGRGIRTTGKRKESTLEVLFAGGRAVIDVPSLVDAAIDSIASEVERLWC